MKRAIAAIALSLVACAGGQTPATAPSTAAPGHAAPAPVPVTADEALGRKEDESSVLVRLSTLRAHPLGARLEPFILAWPGWESTLASITKHPLTELDWLEMVGPRDNLEKRLLARTAIADDVVDANLGAHPSGTLRVVLRPAPHVVVAAPPSVAPAIEATLRARPLAPLPGGEDEIVAVDVPRPHDVVPEIPEEARHLTGHVSARPGGGAEAFVELACDDDAAADRLALYLRARAEGANGTVVRMITRGLLDGLSIHHEGPKVQLRLPATREQLQSVLSYAENLLLPARPGL